MKFILYLILDLLENIFTPWDEDGIHPTVIGYFFYKIKNKLKIKL